LLDFRLNCEIKEEDILKSFKVDIDGCCYKCEFLPDRPPAEIGDEAVIKVNKTRWSDFG